jgi:hypothetical protein
VEWRTCHNGPQWSGACARAAHPADGSVGQVVLLAGSGARTRAARSALNRKPQSAVPLIHRAGLCYQLYIQNDKFYLEDSACEINRDVYTTLLLFSIFLLVFFIGVQVQNDTQQHEISEQTTRPMAGVSTAV